MAQINAVGPPPAPPSQGGEKTQLSKEALRLKKACKDFEAVFLSYMLKSMRKTVAKSDLMDSGMQGEVFQGMMDDEFCNAAAGNGSTGIADTVFRQLSKSMADKSQR